MRQKAELYMRMGSEGVMYITTYGDVLEYRWCSLGLRSYDQLQVAQS
jgi:hypothetical protein